MAEMYVNGVSTRRVKRITEELCGLEVSSTQVSRLSKALDEELEKFNKQGVRFEDVLYSTDDPDKPSKTRKPAIGLFQIAAQKLALDKKKSFTIGDTERDLKAGKDFGTKTILVLCGKTNKDDASLFVTQPDRVCQNLAEAVRWILK